MLEIFGSVGIYPLKAWHIELQLIRLECASKSLKTRKIRRLYKINDISNSELR